MANYDTPGLLYDSGALYDAVSPPQPRKKSMSKVKLDLKSLNPDAIVALANTIKTAMTGNANFGTPNPTMVLLGTDITNATTKINAYNSALTASQTAMADRDAALATLRQSLSQLAAYVENISGGGRGED
jgi:hypothetical protein